MQRQTPILCIALIAVRNGAISEPANPTNTRIGITTTSTSKPIGVIRNSSPASTNDTTNGPTVTCGSHTLCMLTAGRYCTAKISPAVHNTSSIPTSLPSS